MAEDVRRIVGENVRRERQAADLTQAALADRMEVDRAYISALELGSRNPTIVTLWHLAKALDVPFSRLFVPDGSTSAAPAKPSSRKRG